MGSPVLSVIYGAGGLAVAGCLALDPRATAREPKSVYDILNARANHFGDAPLTWVEISLFRNVMQCNMGHGTMEGALATRSSYHDFVGETLTEFIVPTSTAHRNPAAS